MESKTGANTNMIIEKIYLDEHKRSFLTAYIQSPSPEMAHIVKRPAILILPGGGYQHVSNREGEVVALSYLKEGYQCIVLNYSLVHESPFPQPLKDAENALLEIKNKAADWHLDPDKIAVIGFSAGGHLATWLATAGKVRPNALIAGYPAYFPLPEIDYDVPLPSVDEKSPEAFFFHTYEDGFVKVKNSLFIAEQYDKHNIPFELHVFRNGHHGMSLGNRLVQTDNMKPDSHYAKWLDLSIEWLDGVLKPFE